MKHYLLIFQLEEYKIKRYLKWVLKNLSRKGTEEKKRLDFTFKAKFIYYTSICLFISISLFFLFTFNFLSLILILLLYLLRFLLLPIPLLLLKPYELINKRKTKKKALWKIKGIKNLKVVGITGSYGKTSTKNILYQLLSKNVYKTPHSFNTLFGIAKAIDYELNKDHKIFICEMGAYKKGEIRELCEMVLPDISILTGINEQHLERFGSTEKTIKAKFEILQNLKPEGIGVINLDSDHIRKNLDKVNRKLVGYTINGNECDKCIDTFTVGDWEVENGKTKFGLIHENKSYKAQTNLLGKSHLYNILASISVATLLGEKIPPLLEKVKNLEQIPHRLELRIQNGINIIDDTYSSNPLGFKEALDVLSIFEGKKILITPGIVELGKKTKEIHEELGKKAAEICDEIALVGKSEMTNALAKGIRMQGLNPRTLKNNNEVQGYIAKKVEPGSTILLENDLPDQYL